MNELRVLLVDDHKLFCESLSRLLQSVDGIKVAGECSTASEAIAAFGSTPADVVLLDYDLGEASGCGLIAELKNRQKDTKVLIVTGGMPDGAIVRVLEDGTSGVFLKHSGIEQLLSAIQQVANGEIWLYTGAMSSLLSGRNAEAENLSDSSMLTARQGEVMRGILDGLSNKEIALRLRVSESSVKAVIQELFRKAGVRTRSQLVRIAIEKHSANWLKSQAGA